MLENPSQLGSSLLFSPISSHSPHLIFTTCTEDFPQSDPATKEATWPLRSAGESDLLLTLENVQHWLYCDIGEASAPRNPRRPALRPAAPRRARSSGAALSTQLCPGSPRHPRSGGFSTGEAFGHGTVIIIFPFYSSSSYICLSPSVWQEIYLLLLCFLYFNRHGGGFCGHSWGFVRPSPPQELRALSLAS